MASTPELILYQAMSSCDRIQSRVNSVHIGSGTFCSVFPPFSTLIVSILPFSFQLSCFFSFAFSILLILSLLSSFFCLCIRAHARFAGSHCHQGHNFKPKLEWQPNEMTDSRPRHFPIKKELNQDLIPHNHSTTPEMTDS